MKLTVIIPFYFGGEGKDKLLSKCISSLKGHDELIVIGHKSQSLPWTLNQGLKAAHGDFILIMSDDMELETGSLEELCHDKYVTHPLVNSTPSIFGGAMCLPRAAYEDVGDYDENYLQGYYDDDDIIKRMDIAGWERRVVQSVNFNHPEHGTTLKTLVDQAIMIPNKDYYERKWGEWKPVSIPKFL